MDSKEIKGISKEIDTFYKKAFKFIDKKTKIIIDRQNRLKNEKINYEQILNNLIKEKEDINCKESNHIGNDENNVLKPDSEKEFLKKEFDIEMKKKEFDRLKEKIDLEIKILEERRKEFDKEYEQLYKEKLELNDAIIYQVLNIQGPTAGEIKTYQEFKQENDILIQRNLFNREEN